MGQFSEMKMIRGGDGLDWKSKRSVFIVLSEYMEY